METADGIEMDGEDGSQGLDNPISQITMTEDEAEADDIFPPANRPRIGSGQSTSTNTVSVCPDNTENGDIALALKKRHMSVQINDVVDVRQTEGEEEETEDNGHLIYNVSDSPPIHLTILLGFQQTLLSIAGSLIVPMLVAKAVCDNGDGVLLTKLLSSTMIMNGITSLMQTLLGVRLPLFQGPSASFIVPLIALDEMDKDRCNVNILLPPGYNSSENSTINMADLQDELVNLRLRELMWPLILTGLLHFLTGFTGLVGLLMRFIGPITIVPTIMLIGLYIVKTTLDYVAVHWGVAIFTWVVGVILSMYLGSRPTPIPFYSREKGWHIIRYPLHQVFAILLSILLGWLLSGILTAAGVFTDDRNALEYMARTDARSTLIRDSDWFYMPYPGQFGLPAFSTSAFLGFFIATVTSILDSIGDYYACASTCRVPPPPGHAVNRGIAIEGFCSMISGFVGCGFATTTYGGNIGAIGMTKVASRHVFVAMSIIYLVFGVFAKLSAVFVSIPYPVLGGALITIIGVFVGVNLSNLQSVDLTSNRNLSIIGMALFVGLLVPTWMETNPDAINTGNTELDNVIIIFLRNPNFIGSVLACFLDNTIPGTAEERGIAAWRESDDDDDAAPTSDTKEETNVTYAESGDVYTPLLPARLRNHWLMKYLPIFPYKSDQKDQGIHLDRRPSRAFSMSSGEGFPGYPGDWPPDDYVRRRSSVRRQSLGIGLYL